MCDFIFVGTPTRHAAEASEWFSGALGLIPAHNAHLLALLPSAYSAFWLVNGPCSCGLWPLNVGGFSIAHFRRKGWSETKVRRVYKEALQRSSAKAAAQPPNRLSEWTLWFVSTFRQPVYLHEARYAKNPDDAAPHVGSPNEVLATPELSNALRSGALNIVVPPPTAPANLPLQRTRFTRR